MSESHKAFPVQYVSKNRCLEIALAVSHPAYLFTQRIFQLSTATVTPYLLSQLR